MMRAVVQVAFGEPDVLHLGQVPRPRPIPTEVLVRVHACGVNPNDWKTRRGEGVSDELGKPPFVLGWNVSGTVEEVGLGVTTLVPGDEVFGMPWFPRAAGGYAEYVTAPSRQFARKPANLSHSEAASVPLTALTAMQVLVDAARLQSGQRVLVHGAGGGVGQFVVQFAKRLGATVAGTGSGRQRQWLTELGVDEIIDYTTTRFDDVISDLDVVVDLLGDAVDHYSTRSLKVLRRDGILVAVPDGVSDELAAAARAAGVRVSAFLVEPDGAKLAEISRLIEHDGVRIGPIATYPLADAADAHRDLEGHRATGAVVLEID